MALNSVICLDILLYGHNTRVIDQGVDFAYTGIDLCCGVADGPVVAEFESDDLNIDAGVHLLDVLDDWRDFGFMAACENDLLGVCCSQRKSRFGAQTAFTGTRDDEGLSVYLRR